MVDGKITEVGSYAELVDQDGAFAEFLRNYASNEVNEEGDPCKRTNSFIIHSFIYVHIHLPIHPFIRSFVHPFIYPFILFIICLVCPPFYPDLSLSLSLSLSHTDANEYSEYEDDVIQPLDIIHSISDDGEAPTRRKSQLKSSEGETSNLINLHVYLLCLYIHVHASRFYSNMYLHTCTYMYIHVHTYIYI